MGHSCNKCNVLPKLMSGRVTQFTVEKAFLLHLPGRKITKQKAVHLVTTINFLIKWIKPRQGQGLQSLFRRILTPIPRLGSLTPFPGFALTELLVQRREPHRGCWDFPWCKEKNSSLPQCDLQLLPKLAKMQHRPWGLTVPAHPSIGPTPSLSFIFRPEESGRRQNQQISR